MANIKICDHCGKRMWPPEDPESPVDWKVGPRKHYLSVYGPYHCKVVFPASHYSSETTLEYCSEECLCSSMQQRRAHYDRMTGQVEEIPATVE